MRMVNSVVMVVLLGGGLSMPRAVADTPAKPAAPAKLELKDRFGFDAMKPKQSKCTKVAGALLKKLEKSYTCEAPTDDSPGSASGKPIAASCTAKGKTRSTFLLFAKQADCKEERATQLANAEGA